MRRLAIVLALAASLLGLMTWLWSCHARRTAEALAAELPHLADDEVDEQLSRLARLDDVGLPALCEALGSSRTIIAEGAQARLLEHLARWELLAPQAASRKLTHLAKLLAEQAQRPDATGHRRLADVAERMLAWPMSGLPDMPQIAMNCEVVLAAKMHAPREPSLLATMEHARPIQKIAAATETSPRLEVEQTANTAEAMPLTPPPTDASTPGKLPVDMSHARPIEEAAKPQAEAPSLDAAPAPITVRVNQPRRVAMDLLNTIPLAQLLHSPDSAMAASAREELVRRGFTAAQIELARRLTDSDFSVRSRTAASLPSADIDARPWLIFLSRDENPEVRLVALTLMATSGEAQMLRRVHEMAADDPDDRIRSQAQRVK